MANMNMGEGYSNAQTSSKFTRQTFGIADMSIVINLLTKLYHKPKQTLTQEYISNARDANREVKAKRPIEITAPTRFNPAMIIRDFGPGVSPDRIENVFLLYGASTKRTDNAQTGGFGIGGKSAWAYVDSFTIVTYIDGIKRTYVAHKSTGNGNMDQIGEEKTSEPNGTAIQIPVKPQDVTEFKRAILRTIFFWNDSEKPVLNGFDQGDTVYNQSEEIVINDSFSCFKELPSYLSNNDYYGAKTLLVIDGIPYDIGNYASSIQAQNDLNNKCQAVKVFKVSNGKFHIAPNREDIVSDDHNNKLLSDLAIKAIADTSKYVNAQLNKYTDVAEALKEFVKLYQMFKIQSEYKGYSMHYNGLKPVNYTGKAFTEYENRWSHKTKSHKMYKTERETIPVAQIESLYYLDSIAAQDALAKRGFRIRKALEAGKRVIMINNNPAMPGKLDTLIAELKAKPLSDLDASDFKIQRQAKLPIAKKEFCAHYFKHSLHPTQVKGEDFEEIEVYAFNDEDIYKNRHGHELINYINSLEIPFFFVARSNEDHVKSNTNLVHINDWVKTHVPKDSLVKNEIVKKLSTLEYLKYLGNLHKDIKNKTLSFLVKFLHETQTTWEHLPKVFEDNIKNHKLYTELKPVLEDVNKYHKQLEKDCPLIESFTQHKLVKNSTYREHALKYINSNV